MLGITPDRVCLHTHLDPRISPFLGHSSCYSNKFNDVDLGAVILATRKVRDKMLKIAAHLLEADVRELQVREGAIHAAGPSGVRGDQGGAAPGRQVPAPSPTAAVIGDVQIRNRGTLAGSLAHADPAADMPAAILALGGELNVVGPGGQRRIRAEDFFQGMFSTALAPDEILTEILVPVAGSQRVAYLKAARRPSDFALVGVAVAMRVGRDRTCEAVSIGVTGESHGLPTVVFGCARDIVEHCGVPRFVFSDFPLGSPCGKPFEPAMQRAIVLMGLGLLAGATKPGTTVMTPFEWSPGASWKEKVFTPEQPFLDEAATERWLQRKDAYRRERQSGKEKP
jgi:hypothetical protein